MGTTTSAPEEPESQSASRLYIQVDKQKWPILYSPNYDISFWKLETIHPFDSSKWRRIYELLKENGMIRGPEDTVQPLEVSREDLLLTHTAQYIDSLTVS